MGRKFIFLFRSVGNVSWMSFNLKKESYLPAFSIHRGFCIVLFFFLFFFWACAFVCFGYFWLLQKLKLSGHPKVAVGGIFFISLFQIIRAIEYSLQVLGWRAKQQHSCRMNLLVTYFFNLSVRGFLRASSIVKLSNIFKFRGTMHPFFFLVGVLAHLGALGEISHH